MENREKDMIYDWSIHHFEDYSYPKAENSAESYFELRDGSGYIREYGFSTIAELKTELGQMWLEDFCMEEIIKPVAVATMKHKPENTEIREKRESLDEFIYVF